MLCLITCEASPCHPWIVDAIGKHCTPEKQEIKHKEQIHKTQQTNKKEGTFFINHKHNYRMYLMR
jgi:hypothetical protein